MRNSWRAAKLGMRDCQTFCRAGFNDMLVHVWTMKCDKSCKSTMFIDRDAGADPEGRSNSRAQGDVSLKDTGLRCFLLVLLVVARACREVAGG